MKSSRKQTAEIAAAGVPPIGSQAAWYATQWLIWYLTQPNQPGQPAPPVINNPPPNMAAFSGMSRADAVAYQGANLLMGPPPA